MKNLLFIHDYFNGRLPESFNDLFILDKDKLMYKTDDIRPSQIPKKFNDYVLTEINMQPQETPIPGQLYKPEYESIRYGRNSLKYSAITSWNHLNRKCYKTNPEIIFIAMSRNKFKEYVVNDYIQGYGLE